MRAEDNRLRCPEDRKGPRMARPIVQDSGHVSGRYHLDGTDIPVALIKADLADGDDVMDRYRFINLTEEECESIQSFDFPATREVTLRQIYLVLVLECPCGEEQALYGEQGRQTVVSCIC